MTDEKQIEEMAKDLKTINELQTSDKHTPTYFTAQCMFNLGYRNCKDKVVLTNEEYDELLKGVKTTNYTAMFDNTQAQRIIDLEMRLAQSRKETAREIICKLWHEKIETEVTISKYCSKEDAENIATSIVTSIRNTIKELAKQYGVEVEEQ